MILGRRIVTKGALIVKKSLTSGHQKKPIFGDTLLFDLAKYTNDKNTLPTTKMEKGVYRQLETAKELYDQVVFNTDALFNEPAPDPIVAFAAGGVLAVCGILMWCRRVQLLKRKMAARKPPVVLSGNALIRAWISCAIDCDSPFYVIVSFGAASFIFLGGIQLHYQWTLLAMILLYVVSSLGESVRVLLSLASANSLADVVLMSGFLESKLRTVSTTLKPSNVYEDLGRGATIILMTFITQVILISFVCIDMFDSGTNNCRDGSKGCPIGGTLGSWGFYVLGIFMACVFLLGPKTSFGESEQNPAYWLQLLLATKQTGAKVTWYDPIQDQNKERLLSMGDWRIWTRFIMSFLVNGVGFHILVHALPIQVAAQSSLTGVVFRAVGMMYLVDLDDTPGYTLTIVQHAKDETTVKESPDIGASTTGGTTNSELPSAPGPALLPPNEMNLEVQKILDEARAKLDALAQGGVPNSAGRMTNKELLVVGGAAATLMNLGEYQDGDQQQDSPGVIESRGLPTGDDGNDGNNEASSKQNNSRA